MNQQTNLTKSYLALFNFLLLSKRSLIIAAEKFKLTPIQAITLLLLDESRPMNSFTKIFHCDASNTTGIMDGLEKKKLVGRIESPNDRRVKIIKITPKGADIRDTLLTSQTDKNSFINKKLTDTELTTFIKLIEKVTA